MPFQSPPSIPKLPFEPPADIPVHEFLFGDHGDKYGRFPKDASKPPFICGITGKSYSVAEVVERYEALARSLSTELGWEVNTGESLDKTIAIFSLNSIDTLTVAWAAHRLSGVACPISASYTEAQLAGQLQNTASKAIFTSAPLFDVALRAAATAGIPRKQVYVLEVPDVATKGVTAPSDLKTVNQLIQEGSELPPLPSLSWTEGQGARQTAFLCSSSGTSGFPKTGKVSHQNAIANILQYNTFESNNADHLIPELSLCLLPQSHAFALIAACQMGIYKGSGTVVLPGFDLMHMLQAIQDYSIRRLWLIPPLIVGMIHASTIVKKFDLSSVNRINVGAAALSKETLDKLSEILPNRSLVQGYGLTEATCIISATNPDDIMLGSCGFLLPGIQGRLVAPDGTIVEGHDRPGELMIQGPNVITGYLNDEVAMKDLLSEDNWMRTGDLVELRKSTKGNSHIFIVDRIKELIKVHGMQVAPAEIESSLLQHPRIKEASVIPVPDEYAGELPRAYIVKLDSTSQDEPDSVQEDEGALKSDIHAYIEDIFPPYKRLAGGIEFIDALPKTATGKITRQVLKEKAKALAAAKKREAEAAAESKVAPVSGITQAVEVFELDSDDED